EGRDRARAADRRGRRLRQLEQAVDEKTRQREDRDQPEQVVHPCRLVKSPVSTVFRFRKTEIRIARPTGTSAAATPMTMSTNTWPWVLPWSRAKARIATLTPFSITSTDMRMTRRLRRAMTPKAPMANSAALRTRECEIIAFYSPAARRR